MSVSRQEITRRICLIGVLIAANVVLSRLLSISLWNQKIGFGFGHAVTPPAENPAGGVCF